MLNIYTACFLDVFRICFEVVDSPSSLVTAQWSPEAETVEIKFVKQNQVNRRGNVFTCFNELVKLFDVLFVV